MAIRRIRGQWWIDVTVRIPGKPVERVRRKSPVQTKVGAQEYEKKILDNAFGLSKPDRTLLDFVRNEFAAYVLANCKPSDAQAKESIFRINLLPILGNYQLSEIDVRTIETYKAEKLRTLSAKSVNNHLTVLRRTLTLAHQYGLIDSVPPFQWCKVPPQKFRYLDFGELDKVIGATEPRWRPIVITAAYTGLRLGELIALRWCDVDLVSRRITVAQSTTMGFTTSPKNNRIRHVPLPETAIVAIKSLPRRGEFVFVSTNGKQLTRNMIKKPLWRAGDAIGVEKLGWHALRHTYASHLAMRGAPLYAIQQLLGHATADMTQRYAHLSTNSLADAVALLESRHTQGTTVVQIRSKLSKS